MGMAAEVGITALLRAWGEGNEAARDQLFPVLYSELHRLAHRNMRRERAGQTLQTTALINEAYLRLIDASAVEWRDRAHFLALAAQMMRRILVDAARRRRYAKRGGGAQRRTLDEALAISRERGPDLVALDDALEALARIDTAKARSSSCASSAA